MKHFTRITALLTALLCAAQVKAQNFPVSRFAVGASVGTGHTWVRNNPFSPISINGESNMNPAYKPSWSAGVSTAFHATQHFGIGLDLLYSLEGDRVEKGPIAVQIDIQYVRVPLRFFYYFGHSSNSFRPQASLGATAGWKTGQHCFITASDRHIADVDASNAYNSFDYGLNASFGFNQKISDRIAVNADLVYYHGVSDIMRGDHSVFDNQSTLNSNLGLQIRVLYGL